MAYQATFRRYELKYLLTRSQTEGILRAMEPHMRLDCYGRTVIRNLYYDTDTFRLARRSLEHPVYKEKLRLRSYQPAGPEDPVFLELKKKYDSVVYKRRLTLPAGEAMTCFREDRLLPVRSQIAEEINYFRTYYATLAPRVFLCYQREAFYCPENGEFRVTFDENILFRQCDLTLDSRIYGTPLLEEGRTLMEIKTSGGMPLWMSQALNGQKLFKTLFSKYGSAYERIRSGQELRQIQIYRGKHYA